MPIPTLSSNCIFSHINIARTPFVIAVHTLIGCIAIMDMNPLHFCIQEKKRSVLGKKFHVDYNPSLIQPLNFKFLC